MATATSTIRIPQIIRWRAAGVTDKKIADMLGLTPQAIAKVIQTPEYIEEETAYMNAHISKMDEALAGKIDIIHQNFRQAVPAAMRALVDAVTQRRDLKTAIAAAGEILDRDPDRTLAKQSQAKSSEQEVPRLPDEVLAQAVKESNAIADMLNKPELNKTGVN
jgi:hypothetical protein